MVEAGGVAEKGCGVVSHELPAVEDAGVGLHVRGFEAVVHQGLHVAHEGVARGVVLAEVAEHLDADDEPVLLHPLDTDEGREPGAEKRLGNVEFVSGIFAVVEAGVEVDPDEEFLGTEAPPRH